MAFNECFDSMSIVGRLCFLLLILRILAYSLLLAKVLVLIFVFMHITRKPSSLSDV